MALKPKDRPWYGIREWRWYFKNNFGTSDQHACMYGYIKGVEKIRDLTDSEHWYAKAYDEVVNGVGGDPYENKVLKT